MIVFRITCLSYVLSFSLSPRSPPFHYYPLPPRPSLPVFSFTKPLLYWPMVSISFQFSSPSYQGWAGEWRSGCTVFSCQLGINHDNYIQRDNSGSMTTLAFTVSEEPSASTWKASCGTAGGEYPQAGGLSIPASQSDTYQQPVHLAEVRACCRCFYAGFVPVASSEIRLLDPTELPQIIQFLGMKLSQFWQNSLCLFPWSTVPHSSVSDVSMPNLFSFLSSGKQLSGWCWGGAGYLHTLRGGREDFPIGGESYLWLHSNGRKAGVECCRNAAQKWSVEASPNTDQCTVGLFSLLNWEQTMYSSKCWNTFLDWYKSHLLFLLPFSFQFVLNAVGVKTWWLGLSCAIFKNWFIVFLSLKEDDRKPM